MWHSPDCPWATQIHRRTGHCPVDSTRIWNTSMRLTDEYNILYIIGLQYDISKIWEYLYSSALVLACFGNIHYHRTRTTFNTWNMLCSPKKLFRLPLLMSSHGHLPGHLPTNFTAVRLAAQDPENPATPIRCFGWYFVNNQQNRTESWSLDLRKKKKKKQRSYSYYLLVFCYVLLFIFNNIHIEHFKKTTTSTSSTSRKKHGPPWPMPWAPNPLGSSWYI